MTQDAGAEVDLRGAVEQRATAHARNTEDWSIKLDDLCRSAERADLFAALADPTRWRVLDVLAQRGEGTATTIAAELPVSRVAVVKHLGVLNRAGLVARERAGREVRFALRPERLDATAIWLAGVAATWDARLATIKRLAEEAERAGD